MNESLNSKSSTHQTKRKVAGCTHAMHGNDMTENTVSYTGAAPMSPHCRKAYSVYIYYN